MPAPRKHHYAPELFASLRAVLSYNRETGFFYWKEDRRGYGGGVKAGELAGRLRDGYVIIRHCDIDYRAHVLAYWFIRRKDVPEGFDIDHEDRNRSNNRWSNLRLLTRANNIHNADPSRANRTGQIGVSWNRKKGRYLARLTVNTKVHCLGEFAEYEDAVKARRNAEIKYLGEVMTTKGKAPTQPLEEGRRRFHDYAGNEEERVKKVSLTVRSTNTTGAPGVSPHKSGLWRARIIVKGHELCEYFPTFEQAAIRRKEMELEKHGKTSGVI